MRKALSVVTSTLLVTAAAYSSRAVESTWEYSVQVSASAQTAPAQITLSWPQDTYMLPNSYTIYKKAPGETNWGSAVALPATTTTWTDTNVTVGTPYEYQVVKSTSQYTGYGYVYAGIQVPMTDQRGKMLLVVDNTYAAQLTNELARLRQDLVGDGWTVARIDVGRTDAVSSVKEKIKAQYEADPKNVKGLFLFGHVPVPYSGNIVPDGHIPDHQGAWPADGYYGDMDGAWTDNSVNVTTTYDPRNNNVPGDGKFDQNTFPAPIKLMVGRVDLANMPGALWTGGPTTFPSELDLLRNYLNKDHKFRTRQFNLPRRGIVGDFFGIRGGEAFAASGWRNFAPFFGATNVTTILTPGEWSSTLKTTPYLWAYGCGAGSFASIAGLGNSDSYNNLLTREVYTNDLQAAFTLFFGSWLGDWDATDNIMRSVLATPSYGLTCAWSGRPHWFMQHMALGEPIGFSARLTQNNGPSGLYQNQVNSAAGQIHVALMGDPSLRMHVVAPPKTVRAQRRGVSLLLNWTASGDKVVGYHVYRATHINGPFTRLTQKPVTATQYMDVHASGAANYMVRAVKLETSGSGTYFNPSQGAFLHPVVGASAEDSNTNAVPSADPADSGSATNAPASQNNSTPGTASSTNSTATAAVSQTGTVKSALADAVSPSSTPAATTASSSVVADATASSVAPTNTDSATGAAPMPGVSVVDYTTLELPKIGDHTLHVLTPTLLELKLINTKAQDAAQVSQWNWVSGDQFNAPAISAFNVTADGQPVAVTAVGFKRRPLYAPLATYDLRIENSLYLQLASPISNNQDIAVKNPDGSLWGTDLQFSATVNPLRYSPAIHVNQEGYMPKMTKKAMVGYYAGSLGELDIPAASGFKLVDANSGQQVFQGKLVQRPDSGYTYSPTPYQKVYEADFSSFSTPGEYRLVVPGMGGSLPFLINNGVTMAFARAYALGLYHQRCGTSTKMPYTRFTHDTCHAAPATVPASASDYAFTWKTIAGYGTSPNPDNPVQTAPAMTSPETQLFPFINQGPLDVSGGHHDAGDYSKYTINSASLIHYLVFSADSLAGVGALDNLGIPESGDGISDLLQEAKWEADFLAKMQDQDGGFYFLVYPREREYEGNVTPDHGDPQVVWPKTTSVTAASVAALAQIGSSPAFKKAYPAVAKQYLAKARLGWQFLLNAINKYGKDGAYQKITHYGDDFADHDELAWAACQMFLATGDQSIHKQLLAWFDPADPATKRWGWWHMSQCYGHAIRSYAFAAKTGRMSPSQLDGTFLAKCQAEIAAAGDDVLKWSQLSAYGTSFPDATKAVQSAGWYFSADQAFDMAVAYQLNPKADYMSAMLANMNYEGGCNPVNVSYINGLGWKRSRETVSQWALNDKRTLPPSGIPQGNIQAAFFYLWNYQSELEALCFPPNGAGTAPYPYYDRWADAWNVSTEFVVLNSARGLGTLAFLAAQGPTKAQRWKALPGKIKVPAAQVAVGKPVTLTLQTPANLDLRGARVTWEGNDQEPAYGLSYTFTPSKSGDQWVEAEAQWPDGRRVFAQASFTAQ